MLVSQQLSVSSLWFSRFINYTMNIHYHHALLVVCATSPVRKYNHTLVHYAVFSVNDYCDVFHLEFVYTANIDISDILRIAGTTVRQSSWMSAQPSLNPQTTVNGLCLLHIVNP